MALRLKQVYEKLVEARTYIKRLMNSVPKSIPRGNEFMVQKPNYQRNIAPYKEQLHKINTSINAIKARYPELATFHRYRNKRPTGGGLDFRTTTLAALKGVGHDIDSTRNRIITGNINILDVCSVVDPLIRDLGSINPNIPVAVEMLKNEKVSNDLWQDLGTDGISIALLFIPGIGNFLSGGFTLITNIVKTISSWEEAKNFEAAANTGVGRGIITTTQAEEKTSKAVEDSISTLVDMVDKLTKAFQTLDNISDTAKKTDKIADTDQIVDKIVDSVFSLLEKMTGEKLPNIVRRK